MIDPSGVYELGELPVEVVADGDGWKMVFLGVPEGFEPGLSRLDRRSFRLDRGSFAGAVLVFDSPGEAHFGPIPFRRVDRPYKEPPGYGLIPPPDHPDPSRDRVFQDVLESTPQGGRIAWDGHYPKHEFVRWAQRLDRFIFHSSTNPDIEEFRPVRFSMELADHGGRGNLGAVYGSHDGYWSMFFGVVDRTRLRGSMRNGVQCWEAPDGRSVTTYQFSLEQESLANRPFTSGAVYLLPRHPFRRLPFYPGGPMSDEWASAEPVRPLASLAINPEDFPFLDQIAGHDETELLGMEDILRDLLGWATNLDERDGLSVDLTWSEEVADNYRQWATLADKLIPSVSHRLEGGGSSRRLILDGPKPYLDGVRERVEEVLTNR